MMSRRTALVVDDEQELRSMVASYLTAQGFGVVEASDGETAIEQFRRTKPDVVILDIGLPGMDGFETLRRLHQISEVPVIMLTARSDEIDRVAGLTMGADDYLTKPFSPRELLARIGAVLRRASKGHHESQEDSVLRFDELEIDRGTRQIRCGSRVIELSALEFDLLVTLAASPGRVFTREQLMDQVWGWDYVGVDRTVDVHVAGIRKALGDDAANPRFIGTVRGVGYRFVGARL
jgi:two-component system alkaline phosphatase synthesis response regulator PhoP